MTTNLTYSLIRIAWFTWMLFWIWSARGVKRTERRETVTLRVSYILLMALGLVIMSIGFGPQVIPHTEALNVVAVTLTWAGVLFSIWARVHLGRNWSGTITLKQDHQLISTGPYSKVRNPIYTGMLLAGVGIVLARGSIGAIVGYLIAFAALVWKSLIEERMLASHFRDSYAEYRSRTKLLVPYLF